MAPAEPSLVTRAKPVQKTPPGARQCCSCCCWIHRGSTACTAHITEHQRHMPLNQTSARAPAAAPTSLSPWQHKDKLQASLPHPQTVRTVPCGFTPCPQGIPPVCCCQTAGPGQSRGTTGTAHLCWAGSPWQPRHRQEKLPAGELSHC